MPLKPPVEESSELGTRSDLDARLDSIETLLGIDPTQSPYNADSSGISDSTAAFRSARATALLLGIPVIIPPGTYTVSGRIHDATTTANPVYFIAATLGTVTIQRSASVPIIDVSGSRSAQVALSANTAVGAFSVTTATLPTGLAVDDYAQVRSTATFSGNGKTAEVVRVKTITGAGPYTITFYGRLEEAYLTADSAGIEKLNLVEPSLISGITFRQTAVNRDSSADALVQLTLTRGDRVTSCTLRDADAPGIEPVSSIDWIIHDCFFDNLIDDIPNNRIGYGVNVGDNCRDGLVSDCRARFVRHAFTTNVDSTTGMGVPRHITVKNFHTSECSAAPLDTHAEGKHITFAHCHVHHLPDMNTGTGIQVRAPYTTIIEPTITGAGTGAFSIRFLSTATNGRLIGGELEQISVDTVVFIEATDCTIDGAVINCLAGGNATPIYVVADYSVIRNVRIDMGTSTAAPIAYAASVGTHHVVDGGVFEDTGGYVLNIGASVAVTVQGLPHRADASGLPFATGAGTWVLLGDQMATANSDVDFTLIPESNLKSLRHNGTLTAGRTITLSTTGARKGLRYEITRTGAGAFNLSIGGLKNLITNTWCVVEYDGSAWYLKQYGAL